ncbi:MAG: hypothetical protein V3U87_08435 [Methylococcaceae bacterium]
MKIILLLSAIIVITPTYADIYKCQHIEKISYQSDPCKNNKGVKFRLNQDISSEQHQIALKKLKLELIERAKTEQISKENYNKERSMQTNEKIANASYLNAIQSSRQADALELRNRIEINKPSRHRHFY